VLIVVLHRELGGVHFPEVAKSTREPEHEEHFVEVFGSQNFVACVKGPVCSRINSILRHSRRFQCVTHLDQQLMVLARDQQFV
jgi:hypothetical protein